MFDSFSKDLNYNVTGWLVYDESKPLPPPTLLDEFNEFDDFGLVPYDKQPLLPPADESIVLEVAMENLDDGAN